MALIQETEPDDEAGWWFEYQVELICDWMSPVQRVSVLTAVEAAAKPLAFILSGDRPMTRDMRLAAAQLVERLFQSRRCREMSNETGAAQKTFLPPL